MNYTKKLLYQSNYWYNDGLRKAQIRDMSGAILSLRRSLQYNRENIAARNLLGLVYYGIGEVAEALVEWIISKNFRPRDNIANEYIKRVQSSANELEIINQAVKKYNQCLAYCQQNGEDLAIIQLKQVIASHPSFLKAYQLLALLYLHTGQFAKARQVLRTARKLDTTNETTLRYLHELTRQRGRRGWKGDRKKKDDAVEYSLGNETIIQPRYSSAKEMAGRLAVANLFIGAAIGAAIIWFLVTPTVNQSRSARLNEQMREYSAQISSLEAQISAQTRTLDEYRAAGENSESEAQQAAARAESYENLLNIQAQHDAWEYDDTETAEALLTTVQRDLLGANGQAGYDALVEEVFESACYDLFPTGEYYLQTGSYQDAVSNLSLVVRMDENFNDGEALLRLAQAYQGSGDTENATTYFNRVIELFPDSDYAEDAQEGLGAVNGTAESGTGESGEEGQ